MQDGNSGETIQNNIFHNPGRAASFTTSRTVFRRNAVKNTATAGDGFQGNSRPVRDVTIADNNFSGADPTRYNADVTFIEGDRNLTVNGNRSTGDGTLVALFKTTGARITGNTVTGGTGASAIYIGGADHNVTVTDNTISDAGSAVKVANDFGGGASSAVTITRNTLRKNQYAVNVAKDATTGGVHANRNSITGNARYGVFTDPAAGARTDATCNWWGNIRGPAGGDKVSSGVDYKPWLKFSSLSVGCR
ncbi:right-handed parallel beta-helix repeat-containing protein [Actinoplanes sp. NPDC051411]|uniref:NosD domain-containing protein n=1 Tax=Actinoplanes sp. NPDC051411 TaxID=3155522 RepID=UPI00341CD6B1